MTQMLRHKETGELFVYTTLLATLDVLEPVIEDPVAKVIAEMAAVREIPSFVPNTDKGRKAK